MSSPSAPHNPTIERLPVATAAGQLATPVLPLTPEATCEHVRDAFVNDAALFALPVVDAAGQPIGLVNRFTFLERLAGRFGRELAVRKPVSVFMEPQPLIVDFQTTLDELGRRLVDCEPRHVLDGFIVTEAGRYLGLGTGLDLVRALTERRHQELQRLALHDMLTGLPNRVLFEQTLDRAIAAKRPGSFVALLFIDLDRFKEINDSYGHRFGDLVLCSVAQRLRATVRKTDLVARLSGDEFAVVVDTLASEDDAESLARTLVKSCAAPLSVDGHDVVISCSIGVALHPQHAACREALVRAADMAQYHAKEVRNRWQRFSDDMQRWTTPLPTTAALRRAIETNALQVHYQPIFSLPGPRMCGVEALVRWTHAGVAVPAVEIVRLAEDSGLGMALTEFVMRTSMRQMTEWDAPDDRALRLSVNVSALQFHDQGLVNMIDRLAEEAGFDLRRFDIELTERAAMRASAAADATLRALRTRGITLTLDDFGTGYSALSRLDRLPIDALKIDRSFLEQLTVEGDSVITRAIVAMGRALGMRIVGEGVETREQLAFLEREGCDCAQGFLLGHPMPGSDLAQLVRGRRTPRGDS